MRILVTGGTGFLGGHLVRALLAAGHTVHMLGRDFSCVEDLLSAGALPVRVDLRNYVKARLACRDIDVVYHVGALSAAWGRREDFFAINVDGTRSLLEGCRQYGVRRFVYVSSPSVIFNGADHRNATESMPYPQRFASVYSLTKKLGEDLVNAASSDLETVIIRPKAIFGPGDTTLLPLLLAAARQGRLPQIGDGTNLVDLTYVENVVSALLLALDSTHCVGKTYHITNDEHVLLWDVIYGVLREFGVSTSLRRVPLSVVLVAATALELRAGMFGPEPLLTRYSASILARTQTYDISLAKRDLGYTPAISIAEGVARTVQALKAEGR